MAHNRTLNVKQDDATTIEGGRAVTVQNDERHTNAAGFLHKVGNNYQLKVNGDLTLNASGTITIIGARVIINP